MRAPIPARLVVGLVALPLAGGNLIAQGETTRLVPGVRAMLVVSQGPLRERPIGRVLVADSAIIVLVRERGDTVVVPTTDVRQAWVSARPGTRARTTARGLMLGALMGGGIGFALGDDCPDAHDLAYCVNHTESAAAGAAVGLVTGGLLGVMVGKGERWVAVRPPAHLSVVPRGGGRGVAGAGFSLAF